MLKFAFLLSITFSLLNNSPFALKAIAFEQDGEPAAKKSSIDEDKKSNVVSIAQLLRRFDKNDDGKLDEEERTTARQAILAINTPAKAMQMRSAAVSNREDFLKKYDVNGDGKLDAQERAAAKQALAVNIDGAQDDRDRLLNQFDKNANGKLEANERSALKKFIQQLSKSAEQQKTAEAPDDSPAKGIDKEVLLKLFDANKNGLLENEERIKARMSILSRLAPKKASK